MWTKDQTDIFAEFAKDYNVTSPLAKTIDITELLQYLELDGYHGLSTDNGELVDNLVAAKVRRKLGSVAIATTPNTKDKFVTDEVQDEAEERKEQLGLVTRLRLRLTPHHISVVNNYLHGSPKLSTSNPPLQAQSRAREAQGIARETQRQVRYVLNHLYSTDLSCIVTPSGRITPHLTITGVSKKQDNEFRRISRGGSWLNRVEMLNARR